MRIAFFGTGDFAVPALEALVRAGHEVVVVVTQPDRPSGRGREVRAGALRRTAGTLCLVALQPERVRSADFQELFRRYEPLDAAVCAAFGQIIPQWLLDAPRLGFLNIHPSLLPRYRGAAPIHRAIMAGEAVTGVTIMLMDAGLDTGPILMQQEVPVASEDDAGSLSARLAGIGAEMVVAALESLQAGAIAPQPQDDSLATYAKMLTPEDAEINWSAPAQAIANQVRALSPKPGARTTFGGTGLKVWSASVGSGKGEPSTVLAVLPQAVEVAAGEASVLLIEVQPESRKRMNAAEFARGARVRVGDTMG